MSLGERILSGLKTVVPSEERVSALASSLATLRGATEAKLANHETRITRIETMIEIARPDGAVLRIAMPGRVVDAGFPESEGKPG